MGSISPEPVVNEVDTAAPPRRILVVDDDLKIHEDFVKILGGRREASALDAAEEALFGAPEPRERSTSFRLEQRARLRELSTPMIPIADEIMVMPLIGALDAERAGLALEAALRGAAERRTRVVIVDITGVRQVDADVAATLARMAKALGLLGTEVVITGVRPDVAQTMAGLEIDLGAAAVHGTLASGVVHALARTGSRLVRGRGRAAR
ncbi:STAS domain-containing protein [Sorangium sp. So ce542]|uniref:STAS domain-containing protein n=1 Tax=Sorangium sp. So ce542 TaxID=3133316 RepID=UPI003F5ED086